MREWTFRIPTFAYMVCAQRKVQVRPYHRLVRLDQIDSYGFIERAAPEVLHRILLAVADIIWDQLEGVPSRLVIVDFSESYEMYTVVGIELPADRRTPSRR